jgi:hypothetical protein
MSNRLILSILSKFSMAISSSVILTEKVSSRKATNRKTASELTIPVLVKDSSSENERTPTLSAIGITNFRIWSFVDTVSFIPLSPTLTLREIVSAIFHERGSYFPAHCVPQLRGSTGLANLA